MRAASPRRGASPRAASPKGSPAGSSKGSSGKPSPKSAERKKARPPKAKSPGDKGNRSADFGAGTKDLQRQNLVADLEQQLESLREQLAESQRTQFEQHNALESLRRMLEQTQLDNMALRQRCAALPPSKEGEGEEDAADEDIDDMLGGAGDSLGLDDLSRTLRPATDPPPLDPAKVFATLPMPLQDAFDERSAESLDRVLRSMPAYESHYHMQRCVDSALWVF
jgi:hypothetical protein